MMKPSPFRTGTNQANLQSTDQWFQAAVRYLARFDRTGAQVAAFLRSKGVPPSMVRRILSRLTERRYLDDRAYAERWLQTRLSRKPIGRERVKHELLGKGLSEAVIEEAISTQLNGIDEETLARRALGAKLRRGRRFSPLQASRLLHQWGFADDTIARIIDDASEAEGNGAQP